MSSDLLRSQPSPDKAGSAPAPKARPEPSTARLALRQPRYDQFFRAMHAWSSVRNSLWPQTLSSSRLLTFLRIPPSPAATKKTNASISHLTSHRVHRHLTVCTPPNNHLHIAQSHEPSHDLHSHLVLLISFVTMAFFALWRRPRTRTHLTGRRARRS